MQSLARNLGTIDQEGLPEEAWCLRYIRSGTETTIMKTTVRDKISIQMRGQLPKRSKVHI